MAQHGLAAAGSSAAVLLQRKFQAAGQARSGRLTPETEAQRAFIAAWLAGPAALRSA